MEDVIFMEKAVAEAQKALDEGEVPVGAVITRDSRIIGKGYNRIEALKDATAHAEIIAVSAASMNMKSWRLHECTMYITVEPCFMCCGAILQSRIKRVVYGAGDNRYGALESPLTKKLAETLYSRFPETESGILETECRELMQDFFRRIRKKD